MRVLLAFAVLLALPACDGAASSDALAENTFSLQVGDGAPETRAEAHVGSYVSATSGPTVALVLGARPLSAPLSLTAPAVGFAYDGGAVTPGTYPLVAVNPAGDPPSGAFIGVFLDPAAYVASQPGRAGFYYTGAGSITIETIDGERARGTFDMTAVELGADFTPSDVEVHVSGAFHALHTDAFGDEESFWR